ncbi:16S rRNA (guanine(966)-N(2))-methyltransferase RsmD [Ahniella affigens]|uniref:Ribosomal RNA small subunit methyltransferase D n=1 Tax=Ahniella affigens TaxID=2021234 RepID=A0A2P1PN89_9GAMM|nr:16S rRNA (guanine(966)-N(2))-methyltransferase RsmD [Ahniella affigens]AVP96302.1 16S rRNA (guanine(966)-N(2))-methyltransferase RsmD [Ahniella affigens]
MNTKRSSHQVRIIAGHLRGSKLHVLDRPGLRPTADRARETLFNWLQPMLPGARVLDVYAGTGALGIEALSRGAAHLTLVETDPATAQVLRDNLQRLHVTATVESAPAPAVLNRLPGPFDLVFVDPPFAAGLWSQTLAALEASGTLSGSAWIHVEAPVGTEYVTPETWSKWREGRFGAVGITLYRRRLESPIS